MWISSNPGGVGRSFYSLCKHCRLRAGRELSDHLVRFYRTGKWDAEPDSNWTIIASKLGCSLQPLSFAAQHVSLCKSSWVSHKMFALVGRHIFKIPVSRYILRSFSYFHLMILCIRSKNKICIHHYRYKYNVKKWSLFPIPFVSMKLESTWNSGKFTLLVTIAKKKKKSSCSLKKYKIFVSFSFFLNPLFLYSHSYKNVKFQSEIVWLY